MKRRRSQVKNTAGAPSAGWLGPGSSGAELPAFGQLGAGWPAPMLAEAALPEPSGGGRAGAAAARGERSGVRWTPAAADRRKQNGGHTATAVTNRYISGRCKCHSTTLRVPALRLMCALARTMLQRPAGPSVYAAHDTEGW